MRRILVFSLLIAVIITSCTTIKYIPVKETEYVTVRDTTVLHKTDTLVQVPETSIADYIDVADTLRLEAPYATATAWVDSTLGILKGRLVQGGKLPVQIVEKERLVYKDSIQTKEIPVEVPVEKIVKKVPWYAKILSGFGILFLILAALWAGKKFL